MPLTFSWPRSVLVALITVVVVAALACGESAAPDATTVQVESETQVSQAAVEQTVEPTSETAETAQEEATPETPPTVSAARQAVIADIPEIAGISAWLNTDTELSIAELTAEGKVVLVDFWTYTCVNCIRTLPYLRDWWAQYEDDGLVILGIHAPEFEFEKDYDNVVDAVASYEIGWPVAQDNDMETWRNFENRYWPAKYLFNSRGERIYNHFGEGAYGETEQRIRAALVEAGADLSDDPLNLPQDQVRDSAFQEAGSSGSAPVTPELYAGWHRNFLTLQAGRAPYVAQVEFFESITDPTDNESTGVIDVTVPQDIRQHYLYFNGQWSVEPERIRHARQTESLEDYLALNYAARSVNVVLTSESGEPYQVFVTVDGAMLTPENAGSDIQFDENGRSYLLVDEPRLYAMVDNPEYRQESVLTMRSDSDDFGIFAFTFGVYSEGP